MVPSTLHQCIKYSRDGTEHTIQGDVKPFSFNEIEIYEDAAYYLPKNPMTISGTERGKKLHDSTNKKQITRKTTINAPEGNKSQEEEVSTNKTTSIIIDLESSSEEESGTQNRQKQSKRFEVSLDSESDNDKSDQQITENVTSFSTFEKINQYVQTLTLTPLISNEVGKLRILAYPNLDNRVSKAPVFISVPSSSTPEENIKVEDETLNELIELPVDWYPLCVKNAIKQGLIPGAWTRARAQHINKLWDNTYYKFQSRAGVGFGTVGPVQNDEICLMISNNLEAESLFTSKNHETFDDSEEIQIELAPPELEEEIKTTVDELKEINLGNQDNPQPTFISSLLNQTDASLPPSTPLPLPPSHSLSLFLPSLSLFLPPLSLLLLQNQIFYLLNSSCKQTIRPNYQKKSSSIT